MNSFILTSFIIIVIPAIVGFFTLFYDVVKFTPEKRKPKHTIRQEISTAYDIPKFLYACENRGGGIDGKQRFFGVRKSDRPQNKYH